MEPRDVANDRLVANVHPRDWRSPVPAHRYHLVVVGAGTAGLVSAAVAAGLGARVALVEHGLMGGDCLNVGCVPSKALLRAARAWTSARRSAHDFGGPRVEGNGDFSAVMQRMRNLRAELSSADSAERFRGLGVDVYLERGKFVAPDALEAGTSALRFRRAIIATGARALVPEIPGLSDVGYYTNETIFSLTKLPRRLTVIGGGPIGCELAQAFARFGSQVTLLDGGSRILPRDDTGAARVVALALGADGVTIHTDATVVDAGRRDGDLILNFEKDGVRQAALGDAILVATGRQPNIEGLGLESAGVGFDAKGVTVNDRMRTTNRRVFAIGDCASELRFTHAADAQARRAVANALFFGLGGGKASDMIMPWCTYTSPEVAHVGMPAAEVQAAGSSVETITIPFGDVDRAVLDGETSGFARVHLKAGSDRILGATVVAEHAGEMIGEVTVAMTNGVGLGGIGKAIHPYPTQSEAFRKAADAWRRSRLTPMARRVLDLYFRIMR